MKHIYLIGDIHGDFRPIRNFSQRHIKLHKDIAAGDENILICLGDFGANFFFNYRDEKLKEKCKIILISNLIKILMRKNKKK